MIIEYPTTATGHAVAIRCTLPLRYDEEIEALGGDFPGVSGKTLTMVLDLDDRKVRDWPDGRTALVCVTVRNEGNYDLLEAGDALLCCITENYVPKCVPNDGVDYFVLTIAEDGTIKDWRPTAAGIAESFWGKR